jgi:cysteine-rich repeat protein
VPFNCTTQTEADCEAMGGEYQGAGTQCYEDGATTNYLSTPGAAIPDNNPAGISDTLNVGDAITIGDVNLNLTIDHTWINDLIISLTHPSGSPTVVVWNRACAGQNDIDATADDSAGDVLCAEPTVGSFNPLSAAGGELSAFNGLSAAGDWTLSVSDNANLDLGTLVAWSLDITAQGPPLCAAPAECGNGILESGEDCDDGNNVGGDGCTANCGVEGGGNCDDEGDDESRDGDGGNDVGIINSDAVGDNGGYQVFDGSAPEPAAEQGSSANAPVEGERGTTRRLTPRRDGGDR